MVTRYIFIVSMHMKQTIKKYNGLLIATPAILAVIIAIIEKI
jgi:hypothetical protein